MQPRRVRPPSTANIVRVPCRTKAAPSSESVLGADSTTGAYGNCA